MLSFSKVTLNNKPWVDEIVFSEGSRSADFNFGNIYIWDAKYRQLICRFEGRMITKLRYGGKPMFAFPIGTGPLRPAVEAIREFAAFRGYPVCIRGITEENRTALEAEYPGCFEFTEDEDCFDYVYEAEKLSSFSGKSLHGKKNHCNRFEAEHKWSFEPLKRELIPGCLDMLDMWSEENAARLDKSIAYEHAAIVRAFAAYEELALEGGVLFADGRIVGFTVGEMISGDTADVHFEKAETGMNGAYPMVCREFTKMLMKAHPSLRYVNREDDMGLDSLRQSKLSYKPAFMLKKYTARWKNDAQGI